MLHRSAFLLLLVSVSAIAVAAAEQAERPNIVLLLSDDQGYSEVGFHGNPILETPCLDALAAESLEMTAFYVAPMCAPTRSGLMSGRYHYRVNVADTYRGRSTLPGSEVTIAETLRDAGYRTGIFGKWHLGENYPCRPQEQGFEH
ncbi:MAG: sulfatase-like hydrolase/transferase, partial [Planctomycetota bacterium]